MSIHPAAARYAKAIFELGNEEKNLERMTAELKTVGDAVAVSAELRAVLSNPSVNPAARKAVMTEVVGRLGLSPVVRNTVLLLTDARRAELLPEIVDALTQLADERAGKLRAEVSSAAPLSEAQYTRLTAALEKLTGRKISLTRKVDATLIGGVVTRIGDKVYDGSIKSRLVELRQSLLPS
jgi:F-type H+-transporting ATPase subunit delta